MPKVLEDRVKAIGKGNPSMPTSEKYGIATKQLQKAGKLKPGTQTPMRKGGKAR